MNPKGDQKMIQVTIQTDNTQTKIETQLPTNLTQCIFNALLAALPVFVRALLDCIAKPPSQDSYNPGQRRRCD
jgi:hypothetical protein